MKKVKIMLHALVSALSLSLLAVIAFCPPAEALLIELEPDMFEVGTNVSHLFDGVTIQRYTGGGGTTLSVTDVSIEDWSVAATTGTRTFGIYFDPIAASTCLTTTSCTLPFTAMVIQFSAPTNYFDVAASWSSDEPYLVALDTNGALVPWAVSHTSIRQNPGPLYGNASRLSIGSLGETPLIQTVLLGGALGNINVDRMTYNQVPEPSALLLLASGLGMALARRWIHSGGDS